MGFNRLYEQCNHCQFVDWEYGTSVMSGWYVCSKKRDVNFNHPCGDFQHFTGKLLRKQWLK